MKKTTLALAVLLSGSVLTTPAFAQDGLSPTASSEVYDFSGWEEKKILDLFYDALQDGRKYPTLEEFAAIGIQESDLAFVRSHVRKRAIMDRTNAITPNSYKERELWMNLPIGTAKGTGGYPDSNFANDVYSIWNYTNIFGAWNHGLLQAPGCVIDAAHKNGTDMYSGIKFFEGWTAGSGPGNWQNLITTRDPENPAKYKYVEPLLNCFLYFGSDGINYNWEAQGYLDSNVIGFHQALYKEAAKVGFDNFHIGMYTNNSSMTSSLAPGLFGDANGKTADCFLNYQVSDFTDEYSMEESLDEARNALGTTEGMYAGTWIVSFDRSWTNLLSSPEMGIVLWGEHAQSRLFSYNSGADAFDAQENYQRTLERCVSGGNRNPLLLPKVSNHGNNLEFNGNIPPLATFHGLSTFVAERSAIQGKLPFGTHFTLGNGDRYYYKGKTTLPSPWYNMGAQDIVPTYRWLITEAADHATAADNVEVHYIHKDAYIGGSCLNVNGKLTAEGTDVVLFKTNLEVGGSNPYAKVAVKNLKEGVNPSNLYVIVKKAGGSIVEAPYGDVNGKSWEEKKISLEGLSQGDIIEEIGFRVKGSDDKYELLLGKLEINDESADVLPAGIAELQVEVKEETQKSLSVKAFWTVDQTEGERAIYGNISNEDANIDHFELLYKLGENGQVKEIARTTSWADYIGNLHFENATDEPWIGVRAVSTDLKNVSPVKWVKVNRAAQDMLPEANEVDTYGKSEMDPGCDGANDARNSRFITELRTTGATENLNYAAAFPVPDGTQYADARDLVLKVEQGQDISLYFKCASMSDGLKWCFAGGWMDFDGSGDFNHPQPVKGTNLKPDEPTDPLGECIFKLGKVRAASPEFQESGVTVNFQVPIDAAPGKSRLRIVFSDAWFEGQFLPTGLTSKGFTIDFSVEITGNNPSRAAVDTRDQGIAEEPENLEANPTAIKTVESEVSTAEVNGNVLSLNNVEKAWIYSVDGKFVKLADNNPSTVSLEGLVPGAYLVKMVKNNVYRSAKFIVK